MIYIETKILLICKNYNTKDCRYDPLTIERSHINLCYWEAEQKGWGIDKVNYLATCPYCMKREGTA